jgi:hypothetical protein
MSEQTTAPPVRTEPPPCVSCLLDAYAEKIGRETDPDWNYRYDWPASQPAESGWSAAYRMRAGEQA